MKKYKTPNVKTFEYDVGFDPTPSRDDGTPVVVQAKLCCNRWTFQITWVDISSFKLSEDEFRHDYPEQYRQFQKDVAQYYQQRREING